ncbi:DUF6630 family protein [Duganella guangzhouensis]|nr:PoNe immunity protein domain-containing protein [Duganella guangzhouensis]
MTAYPHMRDPAGNAASYDEYFLIETILEGKFKENFPGLELSGKLHRLGHRYRDDQEFVRYQYCCGVGFDEIAATLRQRTARMQEDAAFLRANGIGDARPLSGTDRRSFAYLALAMLLIPEPEIVIHANDMAAIVNSEQSYLFDLLLRAFSPAHPVAKKYQVDKFQKDWLDPVVRTLALAPQQRAAAMAKHMRNWTRLMKPKGWKPNLDTAPGKDNLFADFAFEVALAVAAYDIDDSSFRDHPYYPRDLVDYYRAHIRGSRDSWRGEGVGASIAVLAPAAPPKADLAKSKRKGLARWIELAADGDDEATDAALDVIGKPKKIKDLDALLAALSEQDIAVHADIKDDSTLEAQISSLGEARGLGPFDAPPQPPQGPARCSALLDAWKPWAAARGYAVYGIDLQDDAWHAILVRHDYQQELQQLSTELAIPLLP